jgi:hypothetical protein
LFFNQKELKVSDVSLGEIGMKAGAYVQATFTANVNGAVPAGQSGTSAEAHRSDSESSDLFSPPRTDSREAVSLVRDVSKDELPTFSIRTQGTLAGAVQAHVVEGITGGITVVDLEDRIAAAFGTGDDVRLRLFYMGRELKDAEELLASTGLKAGATIQVNFAHGSARRRPAGAAAAAMPATTTDVSVATAPQSEVVASASIAPTPLQSAAVSIPPPSPEEAWQAMAELEVQLARATDPTEEAMHQQAAGVLRQLLITLTKDANPGAVQMVQLMVPDFAKIWNFEPTRGHLLGILNPEITVVFSDESGSSSSGVG